ncbi:MAG TPA: hypothetical protein VIL77_01470, partial [Gaiellaceae bacterium]
WQHRHQGLAYASSVQARQTNFTAATDSADSSMNTPEQHDGWFCVPDTLTPATDATQTTPVFQQPPKRMRANR